MIVPSTENHYSGILCIAVIFHGPLSPEDDKGQKIWQANGKSKYALVLVDPGKNMANFVFSGNG